MHRSTRRLLLPFLLLLTAALLIPAVHGEEAGMTVDLFLGLHSGQGRSMLRPTQMRTWRRIPGNIHVCILDQPLGRPGRLLLVRIYWRSSAG